jgi:hypothetical protein
MSKDKPDGLAKRFFDSESMAYYLAEGFGKLFKNAIVFFYRL